MLEAVIVQQMAVRDKAKANLLYQGIIAKSASAFQVCEI
jgi:hypothetical protein